MPALLEQTHELQRFVRCDAAANDEEHSGHGSSLAQTAVPRRPERPRCRREHIPTSCGSRSRRYRGEAADNTSRQRQEPEGAVARETRTGGEKAQAQEEAEQSKRA